MDLINELLDCLNSIDYDAFDEDYLNELLDRRDSAPFDTEWCRVNEEIKTLKTRSVVKYRNSLIQNPVSNLKTLRVILISQRYKWLKIHKEHPVSELGQ